MMQQLYIKDVYYVCKMYILYILYVQERLFYQLCTHRRQWRDFLDNAILHYHILTGIITTGIPYNKMNNIYLGIMNLD